MTEDTELSAMKALVDALDQLHEEGVRERVLRWAVDRYGLKLMTGKGTSAEPTSNLEETSYPDVASLFDAADPQTDPDKALVVGYWFQECQGQQDLDAQTINTALKNLGHGSANITEVLGRLAERKPAAVRQTQKRGTTRQARKKYRLTTAGVQAVGRMLSEDRAGEE